MKTNEKIMLGASVAILLGLLFGVVYGAVAQQPNQQRNSLGGMMGTASRGSGPTVGGYVNPGGMMGRSGSVGGQTGSYSGGMMGGARFSAGGMMGSAYMGSRGTMGVFSWTSNSTAGSFFGEARVMIFGYAFHPANLTIANGTTVTWLNMDFVQHTVTSGAEGANTGLFDSHELGHMQAFSYTFNTPGVYNYYCDLHTGMVGTITVE